MKLIVVAGFALLFFGCASKGFHRGALKDQLGIRDTVVTDAEIAKTLRLKPNLPKPFKLGVYFKTPPLKWHTSSWRWTDEDKELFLGTAKGMMGSKMIGEVISILPSTLSGKESLKNIRMAAARHGAHGVLIVSGVGEIDSYINNWGWTYLLIAPAFFVPGSESDTLFLASATLWDVGNEFLYFTAEAEHQYEETYVSAFGKEDKERLKIAKSQALIKLREQVDKAVKGKRLQ